MTPEIALTLAVLLATVLLFVFEALRVDVIAVLVMLSLAWLKLVTPAQAFSGLAGTAVVSMIAVMIMGAGVDRSGIMNRMIRPVVKMAGPSERKLTAIVSSAAGLISAFMQNIGAAALFLPAVMRISNRARLPISRLLMPLGFARMHEIAGQVPYDALIVLVDSKRYGGGSIAFDYCVTTVDHARSLEVFVHELGHSFGGLADEYYQSEVSYNEFYPKGIEPLEPNITALLDPAHVKWQDLLSPGIGVPTEYGKDRTEALQAELREARAARAKAVEAAKKRGAKAAELKKIEDQAGAAEAALRARIEAVRQEFASLVDRVGVFEGAGYAAKGLYRSQIFCIMIGNPKNEFCAVCQRAIARMIDFFSK